MIFVFKNTLLLSSYMRFLIVAALIFLLGVGCAPSSQKKIESDVTSLNSIPSDISAVVENNDNEILENIEESQDLVVPPIDPDSVWGYHATYKVFGQFVDDRFYGYHAGEDVEVLPEFEGSDIEVRAAAEGYIVYKNWVGGYGGVVIIEHEIAGEIYRSLYGHLDLDSVTQAVGEPLQKGEVFALLGDPYSTQTDGERQHLHFSVWKGGAVQLAGYVTNENELEEWLDPQDFYNL